MVVGVLVDEQFVCHQLVARPNKHNTVLSDAQGRKFSAACNAEPPHAGLRIFELGTLPDVSHSGFTIPHTFTPRLLPMPFLVVQSDGSKLTVSQFHDIWKTALASATTVLRRLERLHAHKVNLPLFRLHIQPGTLAVTAQKLNKKDGSVGEGSVKGGGGGRSQRKGVATAQGQGREKGTATAALGSRDGSGNNGTPGSKRSGRKRIEKRHVSDDEESEKHKEHEEDDNERDDAASVDADEEEDEDDDDNVDNEQDDDDVENDQDDEDDRDEDDDREEEDGDVEGDEDDEDGEGDGDIEEEEEQPVDDDDTTFDEVKEIPPVQPVTSSAAKRAKRAAKTS